MNALDTMAQDLESLRRERDAERERADTLAAHVESLTSVAAKLRTVAPEYLDQLAADANFVLRDAPTASLARRDASVAEKALRRAHEKLSERKEWSAAHHLLLVASEINTQFRRQAEGGES